MKKLNRALMVTDHALMRYFERILGYDLEQVRNWILPPDLKKAIIKMKDGNYPVIINDKFSHRVIIQGGAVVTVTSPEMKNLIYHGIDSNGKL